MADKKIKVKLVKSRFGVIPSHKGTLRALGLWKIGQVKEHDDNAVIRGMIFQVKHLIEVE